jgi:uncharacterized protein YcbK (DUF882 family)
MLHDPNRRRILRLGIAAMIAFSPVGALAARRDPERKISLLNEHTGERLTRAYWADGDYVRESLAEIDHVLRDHRTDEVHPIEPRLLDLIHRVQTTMGTSGTFHVISGYRSPKTNALLRRRGHGVSTKSLHMSGMAIDLRLPGRALRDLRKAAITLRGGGVGFYPSSGFVHLDVGRPRAW